MFERASDAVVAIERLAALAVVLQTVELVAQRRAIADDGIWRWADLRGELVLFPRPVRWVLDRALAYRAFLVVLAVRAAAAAATIAWPHPVLAGLLVASTLLIALRWRGSYNGGSDFMTLVVLSALTVATSFPERPRVAAGCLWYIALQAVNSYFVAGLAKLASASWRQGRALPAFARGAIYPPSLLSRLLSERRGFALAASWAVIAIECCFPLALVHPIACAAILGLVLTFHLASVHVFGLNRFVFAWAATYPAIYHCSGTLLAALRG